MLEYHDVSGKFHKANYSEESGRVSRSNLSESADRQILKTSNDRTPANDPRNRGERIPGWGFDPNWVNGSLQMASLVFDAAKPMECPFQL